MPNVMQAKEMTKYDEVPKRIKRLLREHAALAEEEELRRALLPLSEAFSKWKQGGVSSVELAQLLHEFNAGPARILFRKYDRRMLKPAVAQAIVT